LNNDLEKIKIRLNSSFDEIKENFNDDSKNSKGKRILKP